MTLSIYRIKFPMLKIKTYCYISLLVFPVVLSSFVMADTRNTTKISDQNIKQEILGESQQTNASGEKINEDVLKDTYSAKLLNLKLLIKNLQVKDAEIKQLSKELDKPRCGVEKVVSPSGNSPGSSNSSPLGAISPIQSAINSP